jgi:hypothetical protein
LCFAGEYLHVFAILDGFWVYLHKQAIGSHARFRTRRPAVYSFDRAPPTRGERRSADATLPGCAEAGERLQNLRDIHPLGSEVLRIVRCHLSE